MYDFFTVIALFETIAEFATRHLLVIAFVVLVACLVFGP